MLQFCRLMAILVILCSLVVGLPPSLEAAARNIEEQSGEGLYAEGNQILDSQGNPVIITGISWFGLETENFSPHGLWARPLGELLDQIAALGFNTLRLPYSNQLFDSQSVPTGINYDLNPDLVGLSGLEIMDRVIEEAGARGLKVILDRHRPDSHSQSELWYTQQVSEQRWIDDWVMIVKRYASSNVVIGADLHNEPHGQATWGTGDQATDWRLAAERAGNAILEANPNLLIIVQGVEQFEGEFYWWGGNLMGAREYPVRLSRPERLVYSPHTYGPGVYPQEWFNDPDFPNNMPGIWDVHWGFVHKEALAPVILGEFGGRSVKDDREGVWQRALVAYLKENQISYIYWTLNPNSGDTGGILLDDWQSIDPDKEELLSSYLAPMIGSGESLAPVTGVTPTGHDPTRSTSTEVPALTETVETPPIDRLRGLRVKYFTQNRSDISKDSKPEFTVVNETDQAVLWNSLELVYWFTDEPGQTHDFYCDWAQIGCESISSEFEELSNGLFKLHIRFNLPQARLEPGQSSGEIKLRFNRHDWSDMNQADDFSFSGTAEQQDWERVTLYVNGQQVWGNLPAEREEEFSATAIPTRGLESTPPLPTPVKTQSSSEPTSPPARPAWLVILPVALIAAMFGFGAAIFWKRVRRGQDS